MNDNQYIAHGSEIICHAGKKGMKWGQGKYSKLKGYVYAAKKKLSYDSAYYKELYDKNTNEAAVEKAQYDGAKRSLQEHDKQNNAERDEYGDRWYKTRDAAIKGGAHEHAITWHKNGYNRATKEANRFKNLYGNTVGGKIDKTINNAKKKTKKAYRIVKSKAGQIFGKPKMG